MVVGALSSDAAGLNSGDAYAFTWNGSAWVEDVQLLPATVVPNSQYGARIELDGDTLAISALGEGAALGSAEGSVYMFERTGGTWNQVAKLVSPAPVWQGSFGNGLALEGDTLLVGATGEELGGVVYVFERDPVSRQWQHTGRIDHPFPAEDDYFGNPIVLQGDFAAVAAPWRDDGEALDSGTVYTFRRSGDTWALETELAPPAPFLAQGFGRHAMDIDGNTLVIGNYGHETTYDNDGAAFVYTHDGAAWSPQATLLPGDLTHIGSFGWSVDLEGDRLAVGSLYARGFSFRSGGAYIFERSAGTWTQTAKLYASDGDFMEMFGWYVELDGDTVAVSSHRDDDFQGTVYTFDLAPDPDPDPGCPDPDEVGSGEFCTPECPCGHGEGDCDDNDDCGDNRICLRDAGLAFGYSDPDLDVCSDVCPTTGVGAGNYCSENCPCEHGEGDCDDDEDCVAGTFCLRDVGIDFGFSDPDLDVCSEICPTTGVGAGNYCSSDCPCDYGEGDCDGDDECASGLVCGDDNGAEFGFEPSTDVCVTP